MDYLIREVTPFHYEVSKWDEWRRRPEAVYSVQLNEWKWRECTCPGGTYHGFCKHAVMVREWLREGKPVSIPIVVGLGPWGWGL